MIKSVQTISTRLFTSLSNQIPIVKNKPTNISKISTSAQELLKQLQSLNESTRTYLRNNPHSNGVMNPAEFENILPSNCYTITINAARNNTFVTLSNCANKPLKSLSSGMCGLKGCIRGTPEAGTRTGTAIANYAKSIGATNVVLVFKGFGSGRDSAFRSIAASGLKIINICDKTPIQHGGCRPRKARRV